MDKGLQINISDHQKYVLEWKEQERNICRLYTTNVSTWSEKLYFADKGKLSCSKCDVFRVKIINRGGIAQRL